MAAKRRHRQQITALPRGRGDSQSPRSVAAAIDGEGSARQRTLAVKLEIDWKNETSKALYNRLRDLSWMAARYRNLHMQRIYAEAMGWRVDPAKGDPHDVTKQGRIGKAEKGDLSGAAYSCAEQEVRGAWNRDARRILAGQPLPQWRPTSSLAITGRTRRADSGVKLELEHDQFVAYLAAQAKDSPGGCWLRCPIAKNTRRDEHQGDLLMSMVRWDVPIKKATVQIKTSGAILRLSYAIPGPPLPAMGQRVAHLGPIDSRGRLVLRTETHEKDYTSRLASVISRKESWDLIRRRALCQIGWRKGQARIKRGLLANLTWDDWLRTYLHTWTKEIADWCHSQGVGTIQVNNIETKDWPAFAFRQLLKYKASDRGMTMVEEADVRDKAADKAVKRVIGAVSKRLKKRREAVTELTHQLKKGA